MVATILVVAAIAWSRQLRYRQERLRHCVDELARIETAATAQASLAWRTLCTMLTGERLAFVEVRGAEQRGRTAIFERLEDLRRTFGSTIPNATNEGANDDATAIVVDRGLTDELDRTLNTAHTFLSSVQGMFGQMSIASDRVRQRLEFYDMNFGAFREALLSCRASFTARARAATQHADTVTTIAAILALLWMVLFVWRLTRLRARRAADLQAERLRVSEESEARFRELVRHSSDLILVVEPSGTLRYATPSAKRMLLPFFDQARSDAEDEVEQSAQNSLELARAIESAIEAGAFEQAGEAVETTRSRIEELFGNSIETLVANVISEIHVESRDETRAARVLDVHAQDLRDHDAIRGIVLNARDITERKVLEEKLRFQALHDPLTSLPNRRRFRQAFHELPADVRAHAAVLFIDLDGFKLVNDSYGHTVGDELLLAVASRLTTCIDEGDILARQGGDEFLVLCAGRGDAAAAATTVSKRIQDTLLPPFVVRNHEVFIQASIGIVTGIGDLDADQAVQRADIAMYAAKASGRGRELFFEEDMLADAPERLALESDFRRALEREEFTVVYQPKVGLASGKTESLEALVRWIHPTRGFVGPDTFIPFAEESGLIHDLGRFVLRRACQDATRWDDKGIIVAVNLSPVQFRNDHLVDEVRSALADSGLAPQHLELEITESAVLGDVDKTTRVLRELKALGVRLAIDDFGTGYSNLAHIKHYDVDVLKIDQSFVRGGNPSKTDELSDGDIVAAVIAMAKAFGLRVVAEGVESASHVAALTELGADLGQGYWFSKPVDADAIDAMLEADGTRATEAPGR
ncbi:MAG: EAL domain-containing protein [Planctomycetes bacterium]|nr:EAL domain-containing protein [Planctomycetota bacterium]